MIVNCCQLILMFPAVDAILTGLGRCCDALQRPHYLSRVDHERKIRSRKQRTDIGKYSFVNRTIQDWNQLPAEVLGTLPCKPNTLKKRVREVIIEVS